jgi:hypothetical protein
MVTVVLMLGFALIFLHPPTVLFTGFLVYAVSGPILTLYHLHKRRVARRAGGPSGHVGGSSDTGGDADKQTGTGN